MLKGISVNDSIPEDARRVPFKNMIYVGDGPSDIPCFSVVRKHGGLTYAVYPKGDKEKFLQVISLIESERIDAYGPADYRDDSETVYWMRDKILNIADRIVQKRRTHSVQRLSQDRNYQLDSTNRFKLMSHTRVLV